MKQHIRSNREIWPSFGKGIWVISVFAMAPIGIILGLTYWLSV